MCRACHPRTSTTSGSVLLIQTAQNYTSSKTAKFALAWLSLCFQHEQPCSLRTPPLAPCLSAADAFADKHRMGIGGWLSTATDFVWYSEIFTDEEVRQEWPQLSGSLQHYIACFETLAQLALAHCSWSLLRAKHIALSCPAPATRCQPPFLLTAEPAEPFSTFLRLAATCLAGEKNTWADALSRGRIRFLQHRSTERVRITLAQLASASRTVSLRGEENTFPPRLREAQRSLLR